MDSTIEWLNYYSFQCDCPWLQYSQLYTESSEWNIFAQNKMLRVSILTSLERKRQRNNSEEKHTFPKTLLFHCFNICWLVWWRSFTGYDVRSVGCVVTLDKPGPSKTELGRFDVTGVYDIATIENSQNTICPFYRKLLHYYCCFYLYQEGKSIYVDCVVLYNLQA